MRRISDFIAVHSHNEDKGTAMGILRESLGLTDEILEEYARWSEAVLGDEDVVAPMLLGLLVGLLAAEYDQTQS